MTIFGVSVPGIPELLGVPNANSVARAYDAGQLGNVPHGTPVCYSSTGLMSATFRANLRGDNGVGPGSPQATAVTTLVNYFTPVKAQVGDIAGCTGVPFHEPDNSGNVDPNNPTATPANIKAEMAVVIAQVKPAVNASRVNPMLFGDIFTGGMFLTTTVATVRTWIPDTTDFVGADCYQNLAVFTMASQVATAIGCPWLVGELGTSVNLNPPDTGTGSHLVHMQQSVALAASLSPPPLQIMWFDHNHNVLDCDLVGAPAIGATSFTVSTIPGKSDVGVWTIAAGSIITIDPHGPNPETVTLSATTTQGNAGNAVLHIAAPGLQHAHPGNPPVWMFPASIAYWLTLTSTSGGGGPIVGQIGAASGAGSNQVQFTIPAGALVGETVQLMVSYVGNSAVVITPPDPGWVAVGPRQNANNVDSAQLYQRELVEGDPGATVIFGLSTSTRWAVAGVVSQGLVIVGSIGVHQDLVATTTPGVPAFTPPQDNATLVAFVACRDATAGATPTFSPTSGAWTEDVDRFSTSGSSNIGAYAMHRTLGAGTAGIPVAGTSISSSGDAVVANTFVVALLPAGGGDAETFDAFPGLADVVTRPPRTVARSCSDSLAISDSVARSSASAARSSSDAVPVLDAITRGSQLSTRVTADSVPLADAVVGAGGKARSTADAVPLADLVTRSQTQARSLLDVVLLLDAVTAVGNLQQAIGVPVSSTPTNGNNNHPAITLPALLGGELICLDIAFNIGGGQSLTVPPTGYTEKGRTTCPAQETVVSYMKVAVPGDSLAVVNIGMSAVVKWAVVADCYPGGNQDLSKHLYAGTFDTVQTHVAPTVAVVRPGSWIRELVSDIGSPATSQFVPPTTPVPFTMRSQNAGTGGGRNVTVTAGDSNGVLPTGTEGGDTWTGTVVPVGSVTVTLALAPASGGGGNAQLNDSIPLADVVSRAQALQARTAADSVPVAPVLARAQVQLARALADAVPVADAVTRSTVEGRSTADAVPVLEALTRGAQLQARVPTDSLVLSDAAVGHQNTPQVGACADSVPLAGVVTRSQAEARAAADQVLVSEHLVAVRGALRTLAETIPISDVCTRVGHANRPTADSLPLAELLSRFGVLAVRATFDDLSISEFATGPIVTAVPPLTARIGGDRWRTQIPTGPPRWGART